MDVGFWCCHNSFDAEIGGFIVDGIRNTLDVSIIRFHRGIFTSIKFGHEAGLSCVSSYHDHTYHLYGYKMNYDMHQRFVSTQIEIRCGIIECRAASMDQIMNYV